MTCCGQECKTSFCPECGKCVNGTKPTVLPWETTSHLCDDPVIGQYFGVTCDDQIRRHCGPHVLCLAVDGMPVDEANANAEFIVLSCNSHDELVAAVCGLLAANDRFNGPLDSDPGVRFAKKMLAKARGE